MITKTICVLAATVSVMVVTLAQDQDVAVRCGPSSRPAASEVPSSLPDRQQCEPELLFVLQKMHGALPSSGCITADLTYRERIEEPVRSVAEKKGEMTFCVDGTEKCFTCTISTMASDGQHGVGVIQYVFDGEWLVVRDESNKRIERRQVRKSGDDKDPFRLGEGPFIMPFGQTPEAILTCFRVSIEPAASSDPRGAIHLLCVPRDGSAYAGRYENVCLVLDTNTYWPLRVASRNAVNHEVLEFCFSNHHMSVARPCETFTVADASGYDVVITPLP